MHSRAQACALALLFGSLGAVYVVWAWSYGLTEFGGDSAAYMMAAHQLSPFTASEPAYAQALRSSVYPPLFPYLVGLLGGGFLAAHLLVVAALLGATACLYLWLRLQGCGVGTSAWTCGVFALMPGTYLQALNIWTENPYLFFSLLALLAAARAAPDAARATPWWTAAAAVAAASLVRAAALPLLAAFALYLLIRRPRRWWLLLIVATAPFCAWAAWGALHHAGVAGYSAQWRQVYAADPLGGLRRQAGTEAPLLVRAWMLDWLGQALSPVPVLLVLCAGAACLASCAWRLWRRQLDAIYLALYLALVLFWPFPAEAQRLSYVAVPLLLAQGVVALRTLVRRTSGRAEWPVGVVLAALSIVLLPSALLTLQRFSQPLSGDMAEMRHFPAWYDADPKQSLRDARSTAWIIADLRRVRSVVPPGDCIVATKPTIVALYTQRYSVAPPPVTAGDAEFEQQAYRCRYAYLTLFASPTYPRAFYPDYRYKGHARALSMVNADDEVPAAIYAVLLVLDPPSAAAPAGPAAGAPRP